MASASWDASLSELFAPAQAGEQAEGLDGEAILKALAEISDLLDEDQVGPSKAAEAAPKPQPAQIDLPEIGRVLAQASDGFFDAAPTAQSRKPADAARAGRDAAAAAQGGGAAEAPTAGPAIQPEPPASATAATVSAFASASAEPGLAAAQRATRSHRPAWLAFGLVCLLIAGGGWALGDASLRSRAGAKAVAATQQARAWLALGRDRIVAMLPARSVPPEPPAPPATTPAGNPVAPQPDLKAAAAEPVPIATEPPAVAIAPSPVPAVSAEPVDQAPAAMAAVTAPVAAPAAAPIPAATPPAPKKDVPKAGTRTALPASDIAALMARGDALLATGDIVSARLFYERAAEAGNARAALMMAETFDPALLGLAGIRGVRGDPAEAGLWYRRALDLGESEAARFLDNVRGK